MTITLSAHARARLAERFPACPVEAYTAIATTAFKAEKIQKRFLILMENSFTISRQKMTDIFAPFTAAFSGFSQNRDFLLPLWLMIMAKLSANG